ncbi:rhomboid family intramembrane serine protease, partial [Acidobacteriota bacterium]
MIIPIGHESQKVHRTPWISFTIMAACFVIHIFVSSAMNKVEKELQTDLYNLFQYYFEHPYLVFNDDIKELFKIDDQIEEALEERTRLFGTQKEVPEDFIVEEEQLELDRLSDKLLAAIEKIPLKKYGFIPKKKSLFTLLSYMFLHGGWLHLIGNLLLLYLSAPFIEDIWGKPIFLAVYILGGMLAGQMFAVHYPGFEGPLIGAS